MFSSFFFLVLSNQKEIERKKNTLIKCIPLLLLSFIIQCFGVFASLECATSMKRKAVSLINANIYIYIMCRLEKNKAQSVFTAKKRRKRKGVELSKREQCIRCKTSRHSYRNHLVGRPVLSL
jgi:hypothetical protein